ncbi:MAG: hypothetical protein IKS01_04770 [Paludibacteraceae bacterium]|nr:hypothetical protein [Paludibacteraceae bacterium]
MKRAGNLIEQVADMDNLRTAFHKAQRSKSEKREIIAYRMHLESNLLRLREQILQGEVEVGAYTLFKIYDPKERMVCAAAFSERVLHHALMNVCDPYFERQMIYTTYANRVGKGVYKALECSHRAMAKYPYVAKLDVRKYFDSISHEILKKQLEHIFKDKSLVKILNAIIDSYEVMPDNGLPIGNLTSQYFANYYLSGLDHYAKEQLQVPVYIRYMDDILLFCRERRQLQNIVREIENYVLTLLQLRLKPSIIQQTSEPLTFLGYNLCGHRITLSSRSRKRYESKLRYATEQYEKGAWSDMEYSAHIIPLLAFVQHGYTKQYRANIQRQVSIVGV